MSENSGNSELKAELKTSIFLMVSRIIDGEANKLNVNVTPMFTASLVELVYNQLLNLGEDLELFANHAGRSTIKPQDVYMVVRKNDVLSGVLKEFEKEIPH